MRLISSRCGISEVHVGEKKLQGTLNSDIEESFTARRRSGNSKFQSCTIIMDYDRSCRCDYSTYRRLQQKQVTAGQRQLLARLAHEFVDCFSPHSPQDARNWRDRHCANQTLSSLAPSWAAHSGVHPCYRYPSTRIETELFVGAASIIAPAVPVDCSLYYRRIDPRSLLQGVFPLLVDDYSERRLG